jgi:PTS system fructose-specific IIC component
MKIVAVTSCITGIAHTYMAAEALEQAAKKAGHEISVETQGSAGSTPLAQSVIDDADLCIFACDLEVKQKSRFNGKPYVAVGVSKALADAPGIVAEAVKSATDGTAPIVGEAVAKSSAPKAPKAEGDEKKGFFKKLFS